MRLSELLAALDPERLGKMAQRIVPGANQVSPPLLAHSVEEVLKSSGHVEHSIVARRPPVFALLRTLIETDGHQAVGQDLRGPVMAYTENVCRRIVSGELLDRDNQCKLYRRLLVAAWSHELRLDPSETALLGLLRREVGMTQAEHFLITHHPDVQPFWRSDDAFDLVVHALEDDGVVYRRGESLVLPDELVGHAKRALGLFLSDVRARRLYGHLSNADLRNALDKLGLRIAGSKPERIERLLASVAPTPTVLDAVHILDLRELARKTGCQISGSKEELMARLIDHFDADLDLASEAEEEPVQSEPRRLERDAFDALFAGLTLHQLTTLLKRFELKHSGTKERKLNNLWESPLSEQTLLRGLKLSDYETCWQPTTSTREGTRTSVSNGLSSTTSAGHRPQETAWVRQLPHTMSARNPVSWDRPHRLEASSLTGAQLGPAARSASAATLACSLRLAHGTFVLGHEVAPERGARSRCGHDRCWLDRRRW